MALTLAMPGVAADVIHPSSDSAPSATQDQQDLLKRLGIDRWHSADFRGQGVKVAILDTGFRGYRDFLGKALPADVKARSFRSDGNLEARDSQHGIMCGELLHTMVPEAQLFLANWDADRPEQFLAAVRWVREQGARVISCSVIMPSWSDGEGNGKTHEALRKLLGTDSFSNDALCFASAGNTAQRHWSGALNEAPDHYHLWASEHTDNPLTPWGTDQVSVELCWPAGTDLALAVRDSDSGDEVAAPVVHRDTDRSTASVRFNPDARHSYQVVVKHVSGPSGTFHLTALGSGLKYATAGGSIPFPADGPEVIAVGAIDADGHRQSYSSCGPNSKCPKPDVVAVVPVPTTVRERSFGGTSAAAPQAAAFAALIWSRHPDWTSDKVRQTLQQSAVDLGPPGHDFETGYGMIRLP
jgi:subtilisin family serine protease